MKMFRTISKEFQSWHPFKANSWVCDLCSDLEGQCTRSMICSSCLEILSHLFEQGTLRFHFALGAANYEAHGAFLFFHPSYSNGRKFSAQQPFCLSSGGVWVILFIISVSHRPPQMATFWILILQLYQNDILQGMAREYMQIILFQTHVLSFSQAHSTCAHVVKKKIIKNPTVLYHTQKHTHTCIHQLWTEAVQTQTLLHVSHSASDELVQLHVCYEALLLFAFILTYWRQVGTESPGAPRCPSVPSLTKRHPQEWAAGTLDWPLSTSSPSTALCYSESCLILLIY